MSAVPDMSKLEPFDGNHYKRWSDRLLFYLETIRVDYVLFNDCVSADMLEPARSASTLVYERDNRICRGHILHYLSNSLFDIYCSYKSAKDIWEALKKKYSTEDAGLKKYVVGRFLDYKMIDDKPIMEQVHEYQNVVLEILAEGMVIDDAFQAAALIEKLPPSWKEYRNYLKHKKRDMSLEDLVVHIRIEESNRQKDKNDLVNEFSSKANLVEQNQLGKSENFQKFTRGKGPNKKFEKRENKFKKHDKVQKKKKGPCFVCGKIGHNAAQCRLRKGHPYHPKPHANLIESEVIAAVVSEVNLVNNISEWVLDTGATRHICTNRNLFLEYEEVNDGENVFLSDARTAKVASKGKVILKLTSGKTLALNTILHVPNMRRNLVSGSLLNKAGLKLVFDSNKLILSRNGDFVGKGFCHGGLFVLDAECENMNKASTSFAYIVESLDLWHGRLGHKRKHFKKPFKTVERSSELLELIHSDLGDFKNTMSRGGKRYYITFIDDYSRYTRVYLLSSKDEAENMFIKFKIEVENQKDKKIKRLRSDRGGEYGSSLLKSFCEKNGIVHEVTAPRTPEQNGIAERKNRTLKDMMNAMLISSGLPSNMWGEAILSACHVLNRVPHKRIRKTPYELWEGRTPNLGYFKVWGCLAKVGIPEPQREKIGPKTKDSVFIGYAENSTAYRCLVLQTNTIVETRDADFFEQIFPMKKTRFSNESLPVTPQVRSISTLDESHSTQELRRSKRPKIGTNFGPDFVTAFLTEDDPKTYQEAMKSVDATFWKDAIHSELESIMGNHTWELVELPRGCHPAVLEGYCDANWISDNDETNSTSGYVFTLGGGAISWKSSKQTCNARSTMESEFVALEKAGTEAEWLRNLLADIPLWDKPLPSIAMHCDSQAAIACAKNKIYNGKKRHIRLRHNIVRQLIGNGVIAMEFVRSEKNLADPLTKGLTRKLVHDTSKGMGLKPIIGAASYESEGKLSRALMKIQVGRMAENVPNRELVNGSQNFYIRAAPTIKEIIPHFSSYFSSLSNCSWAFNDEFEALLVSTHQQAAVVSWRATARAICTEGIIPSGGEIAS
uniref:Integrase catalytic domain-containing protein n=1 Tax=Fagus sylvatica TaxID=28930 RepID=A0A2N9HZD6_FAGSY